MATGFCPQCGNQRQGSLRFCATCGLDFWKAAAESPAPSVATSATPLQTTPAAPSEGRRRGRVALIAAGITLLLGAGAVLAINLANAPGVGSNASQSPTQSSYPTNPTCSSDQQLLLVMSKWTCITIDTTPESLTATPSTKVALSGTGDKTGPAVTLEGDYTISTKVIAHAGCSWTFSVKPGYDDVVDISTDAAGTHEQTLPISLDAGRYQLVVTSSNCASWTVSMAR
jgi:hypothetical protein